MFGLLLKQDIAIDLGTANTVIMVDGEVVIDEPSIVAIDQTKNRVIAVGQEALYMHEKAHKNIRTVRPLRGGVIADFAMAEAMIRGFLDKIPGSRRLLKPNLRLMVCIPSGITEVEERAVRDSAERAGAREVYLIHEPMAAALGMDLDVEAPEGNMVIDIGGGTTEIAVITLGGIVCDRSVRIAGDELNADIVEYIRRQHNLQIGERTAERIKIEIGAAMTDISDPPPNQPVRGKDIMTGTPRTLTISYREIVSALDKSISKILEAVMQTLGATPPEIAADLVERGIHMAGGGALLRGLDKRIAQQTHLPVRIAEDPLRAIAKGTSYALRNLNKFHFLLVKS